jgi:hypothetical protein
MMIDGADELDFDTVSSRLDLNVICHSPSAGVPIHRR